MQQRIAAEVKGGADPTLILLEHPPTYTLGARADASNIVTSDSRLAALGAQVVRTDRGGDVTFHGSGQIVGYPILDLRMLGTGVADYVLGLEAVLIETLATFGISGERSARNRGVWVGDAKIAAIGVRVSRGITTHGFALNVNTDLTWFSHIVPCGLSDVRMTSMQEVAGSSFDQLSVEDATAATFASRFGLRIASRPLAEAAV
jgi:lipoate-protein ligase B